jgi:release factor glutamine methyltransferase
MDLHYQWPRSYLISHDQDSLSEAFLKEWLSLETQRQEGVPVAYLTRSKAFHQIDLIVSPDVLIPRPETELLVERGIAMITDFMQSHPNDFSPSRRLNILDLGCGSGAIILSIANFLQKSPFFDSLSFIASDVSLGALQIAHANATNLSLTSSIQFFESNWFDQLPFDHFGIILSNPPYLSNDDPHLQIGDLRFEPIAALSDFADGLSSYRLICSQAKHRLISGGSLLFEHGFEQAQDVQALLHNESFVKIHTEKDYSGLDRVTYAQKG